MYVLCCGEGGLLCCVFAEVVWGISFMWRWGPDVVWVVLVGVILCGFVVYVCGVVDFGMGGCVVLLPRLWRLCGSCWGKFMVGGCTGSDCGRMSGQKSLSGRRC